MTQVVADNWLILLVGAGAILMIAFVAVDEAAVARRIFGQFVFTIALPLIVLLGVPLVALGAYLDLDVPIWQALIAGLVIAAGWLTSAIFQELGKARAKAERLRDYHKALYAEIGNALATLWDEGQSEGHGARTIEAMRGDAEYVPFVPREHNDHIFNAILADIDVLPRQTIDAIVSYYSLIKGINALADDMRGQGFRILPQARRILVYSDYLEMRRQAFATGQYALKLILAYADGGADGAERAKRAFSSPGAAPSARSAGSE
jgi:hypothetical protein